ncbi:hypothetical protein [Streptomyces chartreusis]|uniref:hypothetical protein n=1 Tax=Streptomyces chartreusis TaxID=1969 RepID=UPI0033EC036C
MPASPAGTTAPWGETRMTSMANLPDVVSREKWLAARGQEEPTGRAQPPGIQVGGPGMRLADEYDV